MLLDYEVLKQAIKENEEQENEAEKLAKSKQELAKRKIELEHRKLDQKEKELERKKEPTTKSNATIIISILLSFGVLAFTMIFYIILLLKI